MPLSWPGILVVAMKRTRHIDIHSHFTREAIEEGVIDLVYRHMTEMTADLLIKPISCQLGIKSVVHQARRVIIPTTEGCTLDPLQFFR